MVGAPSAHGRGPDRFVPSLPSKLGTYEVELQKILDQFERRFAEIKNLEKILTFMSHPFTWLNVSEITSEIWNKFELDETTIKDEVVKLISLINLKARAAGNNSFWSSMSGDKYPCLKQVALQITASFGSTYLCETTFSHMKIIKSKYRTRLTGEHLVSCLRLAISSKMPSFEKFAEDHQCHASTSGK